MIALAGHNRPVNPQRPLRQLREFRGKRESRGARSGIGETGHDLTTLRYEKLGNGDLFRDLGTDNRPRTYQEHENVDAKKEASRQEDAGSQMKGLLAQRLAGGSPPSFQTA